MAGGTVTAGRGCSRDCRRQTDDLRQLEDVD